MTHWGRQFLVTFVPNYDQTGENAIYVTAHDPATVQVQNDLFNISSIFYVDRLSSVRIVVPTALYYNDTNAVKRKVNYLVFINFLMENNIINTRLLFQHSLTNKSVIGQTFLLPFSFIEIFCKNLSKHLTVTNALSVADVNKTIST